MLAIVSPDKGHNYCKGCDVSISHEYSFQCDGCQVVLHVGCAVATLPTPEDEHEDKNDREEEIIQHSSHEHPLASLKVDAPNWIKCTACGEWISGRVYGCSACLFMLHESCALAPREIMNHPFHSQHPLTLLENQLGRNCIACSGNHHPFGYDCNECDLHLDVKCAISMMYPPRDDQSSTDYSREVHHFSHPHRLTYCHAKAELPATCEVCLKKISGDFYCCPECHHFWLHVSCAEFPQEIVHPLHPDHPLICQAVSLDCSLCSCYCDFGFDCKECLFGLHVGCALQSLSATKEDLSEFLFKDVHKHPMRLRCLKGYLSRCLVCQWPLEGLAYECQQDFCQKAIHKTCAKLIRKSEHPIHPHPLVLRSQRPNTSNPCSACLPSYGEIQSSSRFILYCEYCKLHFHAHCAMGSLTLKHQRHEHSLTYTALMDRGLNSMLCRVCYEDCWIDFYSCVSCNYNLHYNCTPLPPSIKHELHIHPMELRDRVVDDFYDEQYCDLCETIRHPEHGVYYCDECRCAAHIDCVIPEVYHEGRKLAEDLMLRQLDEAIATVEAETEVVKKEREKKLELLMTKLEGLKTKKHKIESSQMQAEAEQDRG